MTHHIFKAIMAAAMVAALPNLAAAGVLTAVAELPVGAVVLPEAYVRLHQTDSKALGPDVAIGISQGQQHGWSSGIDYDWSYSLSGGVVTFTLGNATVNQVTSITSPGTGLMGSLHNLTPPQNNGNGNQNSVSGIPQDLTMMFSIDWVNGQATNLAAYNLSQGNTVDFFFNSDLGDTFSITGKVKATWTSAMTHSPNELFGLSLAAYSTPSENAFWNPQTTPAPAGGAILGMALVALAAMKRRRCAHS